VIRSGSEDFRSRFALAPAKQRSAALSPLEVDVEDGVDETPLAGAPPQANVVETTMAAWKIGRGWSVRFTEASAMVGRRTDLIMVVIIVLRFRGRLVDPCSFGLVDFGGTFVKRRPLFPESGSDSVKLLFEFRKRCSFFGDALLSL
jgi:hypothetical protein